MPEEASAEPDDLFTIDPNDDFIAVGAPPTSDDEPFTIDPYED